MTPNVNNEMTEDVREIVQTFLKGCKLIFPRVIFDRAFHQQCCEDAARRRFPLEGDYNLRPFIPGGVSIATTAYAHIPDKSTRIWIALFTACAIYVDDRFLKDSHLISEFQERFICGNHQGDPALDAFASLLRETYVHYDPVAANFILTSTLNGITAIILEEDTKNMQVVSAGVRYPTFSRRMSGAADAYGILAFPRTLRLDSYIQALPEIINYINNVNDILSFYKEELNGEAINRVSLLAACQKQSKIDTLRFLANRAVQAHENALEVLGTNTDGSHAYQHFSQGFIGFHSGAARYRLEELRL